MDERPEITTEGHVERTQNRCALTGGKVNPELMAQEELPQDLSKNLTDEILLNIFSNLDKRTLMKAAQVSTRWNEIIKDKTLWKVISLYPTSFKLTDERFLTLCKYRLHYTEKLHICNTHITVNMFRVLTQHCAHLRTLLFGKHCTFEQQSGKKSRKRMKNIVFPKGVQTFDWRLAGGTFDALTNVKGTMDSILYLGVGPLSFEKLNLLVFLKKVPNLKIVDFTNCAGIGDTAIKTLSEFCPNLVSLCLIGCTKVRGQSLHELLQNCASLKTLLLRYLNIGDDILSQNFWRESTLTEMDLSACPRVTHKGLYAFMKQMNQLEYLNLSYCGEGLAVNDTILYEMSEMQSINKLKMLDIRWSFSISSRGLKTLLQQCVNLNHLGIYQSFHVTAKDISDFLIFLPHLKIFEFGNSSPLELSESLLLRKLSSSAPEIREVSLINFASTDPEKDLKTMGDFFRNTRALRRFNFCDCSAALVEVARRANSQGDGGGSGGFPRRSVDITTKWECALPPPNNTIDRMILQ